MIRARNRYQALIENIFFDHYREGETTFEFDRTELKFAANPDYSRDGVNRMVSVD